MSVLKVITLPNDLLHQKSVPVTTFDDKLHDFVKDMIETMYTAKGIGLAAVQVASPVRILVLDISQMPERPDEERAETEENTKDPKPEVYINPEILEKSGQIEYEEGCLSIPGVYGVVKRSESLRVRHQDLNGNWLECEATGMRAIVLQHEIDHLDGVLFTDRLSPFKRSLTLQKYQKLRVQALKEEENA